KSPNLPFENYPLTAEIQRQLSKHLGKEIPIRVLHDGAASVLAEISPAGTAALQKDVVRAIWDTGVGQGVVTKGRLDYGGEELGGKLGELGVLTVRLPDGHYEFRGYESRGNRPDLKAEETNLEDTVCMKTIRERTGLKSAEEVKSEYEKGTKEVKDIVEETAREMGKGLAVFIESRRARTGFYQYNIVIGGSVPELSESLLQIVRDSMKEELEYFGINDYDVNKVKFSGLKHQQLLTAFAPPAEIAETEETQLKQKAESLSTILIGIENLREDIEIIKFYREQGQEIGQGDVEYFRSRGLTTVSEVRELIQGIRKKTAPAFLKYLTRGIVGGIFGAGLGAVAAWTFPLVLPALAISYSILIPVTAGMLAFLGILPPKLRMAASSHTDNYMTQIYLGPVYGISDRILGIFGMSASITAGDLYGNVRIRNYIRAKYGREPEVQDVIFFMELGLKTVGDIAYLVKESAAKEMAEVRSKKLGSEGRQEATDSVKEERKISLSIIEGLPETIELPAGSYKKSIIADYTPEELDKILTDMGIQQVPVKDIEFYSRPNLNKKRLKRILEDYDSAVEDGLPITLIRTSDGKYRINDDGNHRIYLAKMMGMKTIKAEVKDLKETIQPEKIVSEEGAAGIIIVGAPLSGKGTYAQHLAKDRELVHISVGQLLRDLPDTHKRKAEIDRIMKKGGLIPSKWLYELLGERLSRPDVKEKGFIIDGAPRKKGAAKILTEMLEQLGIKVHVVLNLEVSPEEQAKRMKSRIAEYREKGQISRADDTPEALKARMEVFYSDTVGEINYLRNKIPVMDFNTEGEIEERYAGMVDELEEMQAVPAYKEKGVKKVQERELLNWISAEQLLRANGYNINDIAEIINQYKDTEELNARINEISKLLKALELSTSIPERTFADIYKSFLTQKTLDLSRINSSQDIIAEATLKPAQSNSINKQKLQQWIEAHPEALQGLARFIGDNLTHIAQGEFEEQLSKTLDNFINRIGNKKFAVVSYAGTTKSNYWVYKLARDMGYMKNAVYVEILDTDKLSKVIEEYDLENVLVIDDASYSGHQLANVYSTVSREVSKTSRSGINIHLAVPFMTEKAINYLNKETINGFRISEHRVMKTFLELVKEFGNQEISKKFSQLYGMRQGSSKYDPALTYFDHKVPDHESILGYIDREDNQRNVIEEGLVLDEKGSEITSVSFIGKSIPPYKEDFIDTLTDEALRLGSEGYSGVVEKRYSPGGFVFKDEPVKKDVRDMASARLSSDETKTWNRIVNVFEQVFSRSSLYNTGETFRRSFRLVETEENWTVEIERAEDGEHTVFLINRRWIEKLNELT
ncbi:nucleoside monophosphate kinase, partial [Elusimicrobiota bacterium]